MTAVLLYILMGVGVAFLCNLIPAIKEESNDLRIPLLTAVVCLWPAVLPLLIVGILVTIIFYRR